MDVVEIVQVAGGVDLAEVDSGDDFDLGNGGVRFPICVCVCVCVCVCACVCVCVFFCFFFLLWRG